MDCRLHLGPLDLLARRGSINAIMPAASRVIEAIEPAMGTRDLYMILEWGGCPHRNRYRHTRLPVR
jgi:hypothetical protein